MSITAPLVVEYCWSQMAIPASGDGDGGVVTAVVEGASGGNVEEGGTEVVIRWVEDVSPADIAAKIAPTIPLTAAEIEARGFVGETFGKSLTLFRELDTVGKVCTVTSACVVTEEAASL